MYKTTKLRGLTAALLVAGLLAGCGGGSDDDDTANGTPSQPSPPSDGGTNPSQPSDPSTGTRKVSGTLVVPQGAAVQTAKLLATPSAKRSIMAAKAQCDAVPISYEPLAQATISFTDAAGRALNATLKTDACGGFAGNIPDSAAFATASATGYLPLTVPITSFDAQADDPTHVTSVLPDVPGAGYRIASVQWNAAKLYFTVVDTITGKAVLGIPQSAIRYTVAGGNTADLSSLVYAASQQTGAASVVLALDGSSSMAAYVLAPNGSETIKDENGVPLTMMRMAGLAAHTFLDGKNSNDEVGIVAFDHRTTWLDKSTFDNAGLTHAGAAYDSMYPGDGFTSNADVLRLPVDYYNRFSTIWNATNPDTVHAPLPADLASTHSYPWFGSTAVYTAGKLALDHLQARPNPRKVAVLMTDGADNYSDITPQQLAADYQAANIPLWTVSFGQLANVAILQQLADDTGGNYISSTDTSQLAAAFAAIQTGIVFQYIGDLGLSDAALNAARGKDLTLLLDYGNQSASRTVEVPQQ